MTKIRKDFLPEDLIGVLAKNKIDGCIAVQADQSIEETKFLLDHAAKNSFIKGVVGWVDLCDLKVKDTLERYTKNPFFKGVRHIVQAEPKGFILGESFQNGINKLKDFNLTYDILIFPKQLKEAVELVKKNPDQAFVLDHIAKPLIKSKEIADWSKGILEIGSFKNVYCKLSGLVTEADWENWSKSDFKYYLELVLNAFGIDRLMFGSDWPLCLLAGNYSQVLNIIEDFIEVLSDDEKRKIMGVMPVSFIKSN
jgi:L-fuconolactonase